jgi:cell division septal protein FtsQ
VTAERLRANRRRTARARLRVPPALLAGALVVAGSGAGLIASRHLALPRLAWPSADAWLRGERFTVHHVDWIGLRALRAEDLVAVLGLEPGMPLLDVDSENLAGRLAKHPRIARARALRIPPDRLLLSVEEREPLGVLETSGEGFDASGRQFPLAPAEAEALPRVAGDPWVAADLLRAARERGLELASVRAPKRGEVSFRPAGREVLVRVGEDASAALERWQRVAATGLDLRHAAAEVDLRFRDSAVLRAPGSKDETNRGGNREP